MDADASARMAKENPDYIVGFKSAHYAGPGCASIDNAVKAGNLANLPVMVDFGESPRIGTSTADLNGRAAQDWKGFSYRRRSGVEYRLRVGFTRSHAACRAPGV